MSQHEKPTLTSAEVVNYIKTEIARPSSTHTNSALASRMARIRIMQSDLRVEPLGGRLVPVKKLMYWFVASAFDRQAKVVEALLEVVRDIGEENHQLRVEVQQLREKRSQWQGNAVGAGEAEIPGQDSGPEVKP